MAGPKPSRSRRRTPDAPPIVTLLETEGAAPLHRQIYDALRDAILAGRLGVNARLPSTRTLAQDLRVARNTVTLAFDQLRSEGYIETHRGGGTRVRCVTPDTLLRPARIPRAPAVARHEATRAPATIALPARGAALVAAGRMHVESLTPRVFQLGVPALDMFPADIWARLHARRWRRGATRLGEGHVGGDPALREAIHAHVSNARGVRCTAEQVFVVNGAQHAIDLVARVLLDRDDAVWMEDPGYLHARIAMRDAGARLVPVPVDDEGIDVAAGERLAPHARFAYVTPSHQFPLGMVMSVQRRMALLSWAHRAGAWILEDDYDSEFRYGGRPLPSLQGLDVEGCRAQAHPRVLYIGTFSKTLAPGFRLGYLIVPEVLVESFQHARRALDRYAPTLEQGVLADFIAEGHYARHIRRTRALYEERQQVLLDAAGCELGGHIALAPDAAGLHLVGWLPRAMSGQAVRDRALASGVEVSLLSRYRFDPDPSDAEALLLNYAGFDERTIRRGVRVLRQVLEACAR